MKTELFKFSSLLTTILLLAFFIQTAVEHYLGIPTFENFIIETYSANFVIAVIVCAVILFSHKTFAGILGFIFMGGTLLKFAVFLVIFYPLFKQDGSITIHETINFFVPYIISLTIMVSKLTKFLSKQ